MYVTEICTLVCLYIFGTWTLGAPEQVYSNGRKHKETSAIHFPSLQVLSRSWHFSKPRFNHVIFASLRNFFWHRPLGPGPLSAAIHNSLVHFPIQPETQLDPFIVWNFTQGKLRNDETWSCDIWYMIYIVLSFRNIFRTIHLHCCAQQISGSFDIVKLWLVAGSEPPFPWTKILCWGLRPMSSPCFGLCRPWVTSRSAEIFYQWWNQHPKQNWRFCPFFSWLFP